MRRGVLFTVLVLGIGATELTLLGARPAQQQRDGNAFMKLKLANTQLVLNGIAVQDYPLIESSAEALVRLSKKAEFQLQEVPEYGRYSAEFRRSAEKLVRTARAKNSDGAALAYVELTLCCVNCHKHLREVR